MKIWIFFGTFNGMFVLYIKRLCPRKVNGGNQSFENSHRLFLVFIKNSK